jgi:uncharacterized protein YbbC (DUF1343 family)
VHVTDRYRFRPVQAAVELLAEFRRQHPARFTWRDPPYEYEVEKQPIDLLYGSDRLRVVVDRGENVSSLIASWEDDEERFRRTREPFLIYR